MPRRPPMGPTRPTREGRPLLLSFLPFALLALCVVGGLPHPGAVRLGAERMPSRVTTFAPSW